MQWRMQTALAAALVATPALAATPQGASGAVYTMTNSATAPNEIVAFEALPDGSLRSPTFYSTGGLGSGDGLGNQGGVVLSDDGRWLLAVNAGSDEVSVFSVRHHRLALEDTVASGGRRPVSVAIRKDLVYVVHAGGSVGDVDCISSFRLGRDGTLTPMPASIRSLSAADTAPAQVGFSPCGRFVVVTEKNTNRLDVFPLDAAGYAEAPVFNASVGETPFSFAFGPRGRLFVSEVFGGAEDAGAVSSYILDPDGELYLLAGSVPNTQTAPCWLVVTRGGRYAFTTNTPDDSLSAYAISPGGFLELLDPDGRTGEPGPGARPLDMDLSDDGRFLYTLDIGTDAISTFRVMPNGSLVLLATTVGVPDGANGLAAR